jgi:hypothetical protein
VALFATVLWFEKRLPLALSTLGECGRLYRDFLLVCSGVSSTEGHSMGVAGDGWDLAASPRSRPTGVPGRGRAGTKSDGPGAQRQQTPSPRRATRGPLEAFLAHTMLDQRYQRLRLQLLSRRTFIEYLRFLKFPCSENCQGARRLGVKCFRWVSAKCGPNPGKPTPGSYTTPLPPPWKSRKLQSPF